jgi:hypothetical protein
MAKAASRDTTKSSREPIKPVTPLSVEYAEDGGVKVTLQTESAHLIELTMSATALLNLVNMAVQLVNENTARIVAQVAPRDAPQVAPAS